MLQCSDDTYDMKHTTFHTLYHAVGKEEGEEEASFRMQQRDVE